MSFKTGLSHAVHSAPAWNALCPEKQGSLPKSGSAFSRFKGKVYTQANYIAIKQELIQVSIA